MTQEPRIRVSALLRWRGSILLCRHGVGEDERWLLPGGGVRSGETLLEAVHRELVEETGIIQDGDELPMEGPVAIVESIAPEGTDGGRHVVHVIFAAELEGSLVSLASVDAAVQGHRLFSASELDAVVVHPPLQRFLRRFEPGDACVYLGALWVP